MSLTLTPDMLCKCYEFLRATPPFKRWHLPEAEAVKFRVGRTSARYGHYVMPKTKVSKHEIMLSEACIGHTTTLVKIMAHEMVHLAQVIHGTCSSGVEHNPEFKSRARLVCRHHGFDEKDF